MLEIAGTQRLHDSIFLRANDDLDRLVYKQFAQVIDVFTREHFGCGGTIQGYAIQSPGQPTAGTRS